MKLIKEKQDLTYLSWSVYRHSSGTAGSFLKAYSALGGKKIYYKLSNFDKVRGVIGHECVNELIVDRLLTLLRIPHLSYDLIHADVLVDGRSHEVYLCGSEDFKQAGESKIAFDAYKDMEAFPDETVIDFCKRCGWTEYIYQMLIVDYLILNRDRHGGNIEVLRNSRNKSVRLAPIFDHGLSLLYSCQDDEAVEAFDVMADKPCNNYVGSKSTFENLCMIPCGSMPLIDSLHQSDRQFILGGLDGVISRALQDKIWEMIWGRWCAFEDFFHSR